MTYISLVNYLTCELSHLRTISFFHLVLTCLFIFYLTAFYLIKAKAGRRLLQFFLQGGRDAGGGKAPHFPLLQDVIL